MASKPPTPSTSAPGDIFATTHWTVVLAAGRQSTPQSQAALEELCRIYWYPLYAYVRRRGHTRENAEDLTQAFFASFLERNYLEKLSAQHGRFRAFLLASLKHFLANDWDRRNRRKRGGNIPHLSLDWQSADTRFQIPAATEPSPDQAFDREWAVALLERVIERLGRDSAARGRRKQFEHLKPYLEARGEERPYEETASILGMDPVAVRVAVHRLRRRYRQLLREEIAQTLSDPAVVDEELRALFEAFNR